MGGYYADTPNIVLLCRPLRRPERGLVPAARPAQGQAQIPAEPALSLTPMAHAAHYHMDA